MSSGTADADVKITLSADDQATATVSDATKSINTQFRVMRQTQDAAGRSFLVANQSLYAYGRAAQSVGRITDKAISLFNSYNLMQIRVAQAQQTATDATENAAQALSQYGANSPQYLKALQEEQKALEASNKAAEDAKVQFALMIASSVAQSGTLITTVIPRLLALVAALKAINAGSTIFGGGNLGKIGKIGAGVGGAALIASGVLSGGANKDFTTKLASVGQSALGGAMLGATVGSIVPGIGTAIGAGVGGVAGASIGIAQNFSEDIANALQGKSGNQINQTNNITINGLNPTDVISQLERQLGIVNSAGGQTP